jgi:hypothetical protein
MTFKEETLFFEMQMLNGNLLHKQKSLKEAQEDFGEL